MATRTKPHATVHRRPAPPLDEARAALTGIGKDLRTGGRDFYGDVERLVRSTRRHTVKLGKALRRDFGRLLKAAPRPPAPTKPPPTRTARGPAGPPIKKPAA